MVRTKSVFAPPSRSHPYDGGGHAFSHFCIIGRDSDHSTQPSRDPDEYPVPDHESHVPQEFPEEIPMEQPNEEPLSPIPEP